MASHNAIAIVVLPVPGGPMKRHAEGYGASANLARIFLGRSKPTKSANVCGLYFSVRLAGKAIAVCAPGKLSNRLMFRLSFRFRYFARDTAEPCHACCT